MGKVNLKAQYSPTGLFLCPHENNLDKLTSLITAPYTKSSSKVYLNLKNNSNFIWNVSYLVLYL